MVKHGDGVRDIAFTVDDATAVYDYSIKNGAISIQPPTKIEDKDGHVIYAIIQTYGDTTHTFIERKNYNGLFLPGYQPHHLKETINNSFTPIKFEKVDHIVGNQPDLKMEEAVKFYEKCLGFHRFWSVDDKTLHT